MRVKVGQIVYVSKPVNLVQLSKIDRILYSAIDALHNNTFYKRRFAQTIEKEEEKKRQLRDKLTDSLLTVIYTQITKNQILQERNEICVAILVEVPKKYVPFINDVIHTKDFIAYDIQHIKPTKNAMRFSKELSHLLKISQKKEVLKI